MKTRILVAVVLAAVSSWAVAADYVCTVYCNNGKTQSVVNASSSSDAAKQLDSSQAVVNQICQAAKLGNASTSSMGSSQCSKK
ncbi:hypothetical protein [Propionivibrio sp.]|uniref:hypothetical protein n=1 Tax=Propionivibrio sp. TaxID=2212460 RepID=UPI003BEF9C0C